LFARFALILLVPQTIKFLYTALVLKLTKSHAGSLSSLGSELQIVEKPDSRLVDCKIQRIAITNKNLDQNVCMLLLFL